MRAADPQQTFAELRRQLNERTAERDEALERETATAEVLQVINASPGDLTSVFDAILEKAHRLCGVAFGTLQLYEDEHFRAVATHGMPEEMASFLRQPYRMSEPDSIGGHLIAGGRFHQVSDLAKEVAQSSSPQPRRKAALEICGIRTLLFVPLRRRGELVGLISAGRDEVRPFLEKEIALLERFAAQAVIAIENARLLTETREALEQQTATAAVLQVINASPGDLAPVFEEMLEKALHLCGAAFGTLYTYDGALFHVMAYRGEPGYGDYLRRGSPFRPERAVTFQRILQGAEIVHIADVLEDEAYRSSGTSQAAVDISGMRSLVSVPLRKDGRLFGSLAVYRQEVRLFSGKQIALLQNFAAQAVIAMENARLITETREALDQQTATAEVLQVINSSPGDLTPVFDAMLEKAMRLCEAAFGILLTYDGEHFHHAALHSIPPAYADFMREHPPVYGPNNAPGRLALGEQLVHIVDISDNELYRTREPNRRAIADLAGARTVVAVGLRKDGVLLGAIVVFRQEVRPFSDKQIALLQNFAAQAVIAMENARLLGQLRQRTEEVAELNRGLEARVAEQVDELGRVGRLKRFLAPQVAELIVSRGDEKILESHRREIVVVFCDLRGYTAFTETAEPEEVLDFLREYHGALGPLVSQFEGTLDQFSGDGIMVFFNDPVPCPDPAERAVKMAMAMREAANMLITDWRERGRDLGFGAGIAQGYATLGQIGFSERSGYTAIGTVCNVAARLCAEAKDGQILLSQRVNIALKGSVATEQVGALALKGLTQPVVAYNVLLAAIEPALRVIEGGPPSS